MTGDGRRGPGGWRNDRNCRLCGASKHLTLHHLVPRHWFKSRRRFGHLISAFKNDPRNLILLCRHCHDNIDNGQGLDRRTRAIRRSEARRKLRGHLNEAEVAFIIEVVGELWLESHYPTVVVAHDEAKRPAFVAGVTQEATRQRALAAFKEMFRSAPIESASSHSQPVHDATAPNS